MEGGCAGAGGVGFLLLVFAGCIAFRGHASCWVAGRTASEGLPGMSPRGVCGLGGWWAENSTEVAFEPFHGLLNALLGGGVAGAVVDETGVFVGGQIGDAFVAVGGFAGD